MIHIPMDIDEREYRFNGLVGKTYFSKGFGAGQRFASNVFDGGESVMEYRIGIHQAAGLSVLLTSLSLSRGK